MTPDEAISAAFRASSRELARVPVRPDAYEAFLIKTSEHLDLAAQLLTRIASERENSNADTLTTLEQCGLREMLQATVSALLALGHYPYLKSINLEGELLQ